jgi:cytoskeleton protein RodZ
MASEEESANAEGEARAGSAKRWPGHELAAARERAGLELASMAATLHLPERQLEALERDDYQRLPAPTFVRGYLRAYAREVGLDGDDIVQAYDRLGPGAEEPALRVAQPADAGHPPGRGLVLGLGVVIAVVVLGLAGWWWQSHGPGAPPEPFMSADSETSSVSAGEDGGSDAGESGDPAGTTGGSTAEAPSGEPGETPEPTTAASSDGDGDADARLAAEAAERGGEPPTGGESGVSLQTAGTETGVEGPEADTADSEAAGGGTTSGPAGEEDAAPTQTRTPADSGEAGGQATAEETQAVATVERATGEDPETLEEQAAPAAEDTATDDYEPPDVTASAGEAVAPAGEEGPDEIVLRIEGRSWIEVYDARGRELVYTLYTGDAPLRINGWAPFDVFLGNSPDVEVVYGGSAVEKSAFTRSDQTARFLVDEQGARRR